MIRSTAPAPLGYEALAASLAPHKAMLSEAGWLYLINDTNDFMRIFLGLDCWTGEDARGAEQVLKDRIDTLSHISIPYRKFIIPEKPVVYPEFLPKMIHGRPHEMTRPAEILAERLSRRVFYLGPFLQSAKHIGQLYFRGDTHPSWLGAWLVYRFVIHHLSVEGLIGTDALFDMKHLAPSIAAYDGDLLDHLSPAERQRLQAIAGYHMARNGLEYLLKFDIPPNLRMARRATTPAEYQTWYASRETFVFERDDRKGPTVIFFRDSTLDRGAMELLAEHCARAVFIWHLGLVDSRAIRMEKPDLVVHCMAERFVTRYPTFPSLFGLDQE